MKAVRLVPVSRVGVYGLKWCVSIIPAKHCADNQASLWHLVQNIQLWVCKAQSSLAWGVSLWYKYNDSVEGKSTLAWVSFLMICENRIFTYVWGGVGEACLASWWWMGCLWNCFLSPCPYECYLTVLKCTQSTTKLPKRKVFFRP